MALEQLKKVVDGAETITVKHDGTTNKGHRASEYVKEVLSTMKDDEITMIVKKDALIIELGNRGENAVK